MSDYPRSHRVADFIQRELSGMIRTEIRDPRVSPMLTVASVEVSRDLSVAKVYYSLLDPAERKETQAALKRASGFLRRRLAQEMQIRSVPELRFHYDDSAERGAAMSALIDRAVASNTTDEDGIGATGSPDAGSGAQPAGGSPGLFASPENAVDVSASADVPVGREARAAPSAAAAPREVPGGGEPPEAPSGSRGSV